jgi:hypothetical protein
MMRSLKGGSQLKVKRSFDDFFADRIVQSTSEPTLLDAIERLAKTMDSSIELVGGKRTAAFMASANSAQAPAILAWLRKHPRIAAMISALRNEDDYQVAVASIILPPVSSDEHTAIATQPSFDVAITAELLAPLAHGADGKAGNATLFRRRQVITPGGQVMELPFYAGNAIRGQIRDLLADHLLRSLGLIPRKDKPPVALWFFHVIYAGGVLEEQSKIMAAISKELGKNGSLRTDGIRRIRDMLPSLSLLGSAIGNKVLPGRVYVNDLRPRCLEWGTGTITAAELMEWTFLTRREDYEGRTAEDEHTGMIANTECIKAGAVLTGGIDIDTHANDLERSSLGCGLALLKERGFLGAENRRGLGKVDLVIEGVPDQQPYLDWLENNQGEIKAYLTEIGAIHAPGATDSASDL